MNSKLIPLESGEHVLILTVPGKVRAREGCEDGIGSQKEEEETFVLIGDYLQKSTLHFNNLI
jgi:hypothetical protein